MFGNLSNLFRGLFLLRHSEVRKTLGEMRLKRLMINRIREHSPRAKLSDGIEWIAYEKDRFIIEENATVCHGSILAFGDELNGFGKIFIGHNTWIGQYNNIRACSDGDIRIGANCLISQFCTMIGSNHMIQRDQLIMAQGPDKRRLGIKIDNDVWLGAGVSVMPGASIGTGAVVGANSVVTKPIPEYEIWAGCPARKIDERV